MSLLDRILIAFNKQNTSEKVSARCCPNCGYWTQQFNSKYFRFWLPKQISDHIGNTGLEEEYREKRSAYGMLWAEGHFTIRSSEGHKKVTVISSAHFIEYKASLCPVCDTPFSQWQKGHLVCKTCGGNALSHASEESSLIVRCGKCGFMHHIRDVEFKQ